MPLIKVQTSQPTPVKADVEALLLQLSSQLASHLGKPEAYVMTTFEADVAMTFAGTTEPVCYVEVKSIGTMGDRTTTMSKEFCRIISAAINVPQNRIYIEFADAKGSMWGWNGQTFG